MSQVVDIQQADDPRDVIHQAVHLLSEGKLVAFPTETVYLVGAASLQPAAVEQLCRLLGAGNDSALTVKGWREANDYVPALSRLAQKLLRRCWPGPVTVAIESPSDSGLLSALPPQTREAVISAGYVRFRAPAHEVAHQMLRLLPAPLVVSPDRLADGGQPMTADQVVERFGDSVSLVIDDGPGRYGQPSSVVRISGEQWDLLQDGVVSRSMLTRLTGEIYLFVCTGNTCRSPMAEALFRKFLSERLECTEEELVDRGYIVISAGLAAANGLPASPEAVDVVRERGANLSGHVSQPLTDQLLDQADHIYAMTRGHLASIKASRPDVADRVELLVRDGSDIPDPISAGRAAYLECERQIETQTRSIVDTIEIRNDSDNGKQ